MASAVVIGLAAAVGLVGTATPAMAAPCFEATCDNRALSGTDCATNQLIYDDYQVMEGSTVSLALQLMYSPGCHAFWGELQAPNSFTLGTLYAIPEYGGLEQVLEWGQTTDGVLETHMWNSSGHSVKFCWAADASYNFDPGDTSTPKAGCTGWR